MVEIGLRAAIVAVTVGVVDVRVAAVVDADVVVVVVPAVVEAADGTAAAAVEDDTRFLSRIFTDSYGQEIQNGRNFMLRPFFLVRQAKLGAFSNPGSRTSRKFFIIAGQEVPFLRFELENFERSISAPRTGCGVVLKRTFLSFRFRFA